MERLNAGWRSEVKRVTDVLREAHLYDHPQYDVRVSAAQGFMHRDGETISVTASDRRPHYRKPANWADEQRAMVAEVRGVLEAAGYSVETQELPFGDTLTCWPQA